MKRCYLIALLGISVVAVAADPDVTSNWPQWRGPQSQGIAAGKNLPSQWSATSNVVWKAPLPGRGHSSPIIWGNTIFLTTAVEGDLIEGRPKGKTHKIPFDFVHPDAAGYDHKQIMKVLAVDAKSGSVLWEKTVYNGPTFDSAHRNGSFASPTPVTDGQYVYSFFGPEGLYAHDFQGKEVWKASTGEFGSVSVGYGSSPVLYENLVIVLCDDDMGKNSSLQAFDKKTGKPVWNTKRPTGASWSTPVLARSGQHSELLTNGNEFIISYDPATGKELWRAEGVGSNAVATPLLKDDIAIFSTGYPKKKTLAVRLGGSGDLTGAPNILWSYLKGTGYTPSEIVYGDYIYLIADNGVLTCLDAKTGAVKYDNGRTPTPGHFTSSPVAYDGKIFITSEEGDTYVIQAGPEYKVLATNSLDEPVYASLAIAGGNLYIRGVKNLYKIAKGKE
jgi:outer membrane protein assembly factor BamB